MQFTRRGLIHAGTLSFAALTLRQSDARSLHGFVPPPLYEGLVATRSFLMQNRDSTNKQVMSRKVHISTETLTSIRVGFAGFVASQPDFGIGASSTIAASIEYPSGTFTQLLFSGSASGTIPDLGVLYSDYVSVSIPASTPFWLRAFVTSTAGVLFYSGRNTFYGEAAAYAVSGLTDQTMGGTITDSGANKVYTASAILGLTRNASAVVLGDSISTGAGGDGTGAQNGTGSVAGGFDDRSGIIAQSFPATFPFLKLDMGSDNATNFISFGGIGRKLFIQKSSHIICQLGVNDFGTLGKTSAQLISALQGIFALGRADQKIIQSTITPNSTSTDGWATLGNQTTINPTGHSTFNSALRAGTTGLSLAGYYDLASVVESSSNSDLWAVNGVSGFGTADGLHPNAYSRFVSSGLVTTPVWP
jgi:hypothetical protein